MSSLQANTLHEHPWDSQRGQADFYVACQAALTAARTCTCCPHTGISGSCLNRLQVNMRHPLIAAQVCQRSRFLVQELDTAWRYKLEDVAGVSLLKQQLDPAWQDKHDVSE